MTATRFDDDMRTEPLGGGRHRVEIRDHWNVVTGPNGGYVAALLASAMTAEVDEPRRQLRSITAHFCERPRFGPALIEVTVLRRGRSLSNVSAHLRQDERIVATALAAFSVPWESPVSWGAQGLPGHAHAEPVGGVERIRPPHLANYDVDLRLPAPMFSGHPEARVGGWIRTADPRPVDPVALVAFSDALPPAPFTRMTEPMAVPTVDLTVHVRASLPHPGLAPEAHVYADFVTHHAADGFHSEDGTIWAPDGTVLAESRQLAITR